MGTKNLGLGEYITISEASEILSVSPMTLRRWDNSGKLKTYRHPINNYRLYKREELEALIKEVTKI